MRLLKWAIGGLIGLLSITVVVFVGAAYYLLTSEGGTRQLVDLAEQYVPQLNLEEVRGTLSEGLSISRLSYVTEALKVEARQVQVAVDLWAVLGLDALAINHVQAATVHVQTLAESPPNEPPTTDLSEFSLPAAPLPLLLDTAMIGSLTVNEVSLQELGLSGAWLEDGLELSRFSAAFEQLLLTGSVGVTTEVPLEFDIDLAWALAEQQQEGELTARGTLQALAVAHVYRQAAGSVRSEGTLNVADPNLLLADLTHEIADFVATPLTVRTRIEGGTQQFRTTFSGQYAEIPYEGLVQLDLAGDEIAVNLERLVLAEAVTVEGTVDVERRQAKLTFDARDLSALDARVQGALAGDVLATEERISGKAVLSDGVAADVQLGQVNLQFDLPLAGNEPLSLVASAPRIVLPGEAAERIEDTKLEVTGTMQDFSFDLSASTGRFAGTAQRTGDELKVTLQDGGALTLRETTLRNAGAIAITVVGTEVRVGAHCWRGLANVCIDDAAYLGGELQASGRLNELTLASLHPWMPEGFAPQGEVTGSWRVSQQDAAWQAQAEVEVARFELLYEGQQLNLDSIEVELVASPASVELRFAGDAAALRVRGTAQALGLDESAQLTAQADLDLNISESPLQIAGVKRAEGAVSANLSVDGTLGQPEFAMSGTWQNGSIRLLDPELELIEIDTRWETTSAGWKIEGQAKPPEGGSLVLSGQGDGYSLQNTITASVKGSAIPLRDEFWRLVAEPDLNLVARDGNIQFDGRVAVPEAKIEIKTLPQSLPKPSPDVRVVGRTAEEGGGANVQGELQVVLGKDVRFKLFGLDVRLGGTLDAQVQNQDLTRLEGDLQVVEGKLSAGGQTLNVQEGLIAFTGDPLLPYVDIVATREIEDQTPPVKVGLRIQGRSDDLETSVYSEPSMSESRALSFLVLGRDVNQGGGSDLDRQQMVTAALGFGLKQGQGVVKDLRDALGLDELTALSAAQNDVAIVAGKKVTEDLYVRYSYNAISAVGSLIIRYYLTDRWRLEASNDVSPSMDLFYEFTK